ncbi:MAG: type II toxin-antitoxin system Phd/YefM family antitoxin [Deltaproteobacteria bacterium]|nr:type II toxin-antitoxin system Phd/YefM family antitoxin [Deltaproteobacteria bacterium]
MDDLQRIIPITTMKKNLLDIIKDMANEDSTVTVTKNGMAVGVMMTPDRYIGLLETIEILSDPGIIKVLDASRNDFKANKVYTHKDTWVE